MSSFEHANICKKTNFYSLNIAPQDFNSTVDGVLSISNNLTNAIKYEFKVNASTNVLDVTRIDKQGNKKLCFSVLSNGDFDLKGGNLLNCQNLITTLNQINAKVQALDEYARVMTETIAVENYSYSGTYQGN